MAATRQQMTSGAQSASGNTASFSVKTLTMLAVVVDITAVSGTSPSLTIFLDGSCDGGTTWTGITADYVWTEIAGATDVTAGTGKRNINSSGSSIVSRHGAIYKHLPFQYVRLRWYISGTGPSFTFTAYYEGK